MTPNNDIMQKSSKFGPLGRTNKLQKIKPRKNKIVPNIVRENTIPLSFSYSPEAIKANA